MVDHFVRVKPLSELLTSMMRYGGFIMADPTAGIGGCELRS